MDAIGAVAVLGASGVIVAIALFASAKLALDSVLLRACRAECLVASPSARRGLAMVGWSILAVVAATLVGVVPISWLATPFGATWLALGLLGGVSLIAWTRSAADASAARTLSINTPVAPASTFESRKAA